MRSPWGGTVWMGSARGLLRKFLVLRSPLVQRRQLSGEEIWHNDDNILHASEFVE